jgi:hypothetical protein
MPIINLYIKVSKTKPFYSRWHSLVPEKRRSILDNEPQKEDPLGEILKAFENPNEIEKIQPQPEYSADTPLDLKLLKYIKNANKQGQKFESIRRDLLRGGHSASKVDRHIKIVEDERKRLIHQTWFRVMIVMFVLALVGAVAVLLLNV